MQGFGCCWHRDDEGGKGLPLHRATTELYSGRNSELYTRAFFPPGHLHTDPSGLYTS